MTNLPATPPPGRKRKHRPISVDLNACLFRLGIDPERPWHMDHQPPLAMRPFDPIKNDYDPPENDYHYMAPMQEPAHREQTAKVDAPRIAKTRRVAKKQRRHAELRGATREKWPNTDKPTRWPKGRKIASRPFPKKKGRE